MIDTGHQQTSPASARRLLPRFPLGRVVLARGAAAILQDHQDQIVDMLKRHSTGDWGIMCASDQELNEQDLKDGGRVMSRYIALNHQFNVFTNGDRSITFIELPSEY